MTDKTCVVLITEWTDEDQMLVFGSVKECARWRVELGVLGCPSIGGDWAPTLEEAKQAGVEEARRLGFDVKSFEVFRSAAP